VQGRGSRFRWAPAPELVDQTVARDDLVRPDEQGSEQRLLVRAADPDLTPVSEDLDGAEDAEFEGVARAVVRLAKLPRRVEKNDL
jgi:hypothetical protein